MALTGGYEPNALGWVREHVEQIVRTGTDRRRHDQWPAHRADHLPGRQDRQGSQDAADACRAPGCCAAVASKGGAPNNPQWYASLVAEPVIELHDGAMTRQYRARAVFGDEKALWWRRAVDAYPDYADYQRKTDRPIPVFVLEPVRPSHRR